jgi:hypothetical protein
MYNATDHILLVFAFSLEEYFDFLAIDVFPFSLNLK